MNNATIYCVSARLSQGIQLLFIYLTNGFCPQDSQLNEFWYTTRWRGQKCTKMAKVIKQLLQSEFVWNAIWEESILLGPRWLLGNALMVGTYSIIHLPNRKNLWIFSVKYCFKYMEKSVMDFFGLKITPDLVNMPLNVQKSESVCWKRMFPPNEKNRCFACAALDSQSFTDPALFDREWFCNWQVRIIWWGSFDSIFHHFVKLIDKRQGGLGF